MNEVITSLVQAQNFAYDQISTLEYQVEECQKQLSELQKNLRYFQYVAADLAAKISEYYSFLDDMPNQLSSLPTYEQQSLSFVPSSGGHASKIDANGMQLKQIVFEALFSLPRGGDVRAIIQAIERIFNLEVARTQVSPILSRMKHDGLVDFNGESWSVTKRGETARMLGEI